MAIHGYRDGGHPMFDNMKEFAGYERVQQEQKVANRNKFDWCHELGMVNRDISKALGAINFCGANKSYIEELESLKGEFDNIYKKMIDAPKNRLENTDIIDEYLSDIEVL